MCVWGGGGAALWLAQQSQMCVACRCCNGSMFDFRSTLDFVNHPPRMYLLFFAIVSPVFPIRSAVPARAAAAWYLTPHVVHWHAVCCVRAWPQFFVLIDAFMVAWFFMLRFNVPQAYIKLVRAVGSVPDECVCAVAGR